MGRNHLARAAGHAANAVLAAAGYNFRRLLARRDAIAAAAKAALDNTALA